MLLMATRSRCDPFQVWVCTSSEAITALVLNSAAAITQQDKYEQALIKLLDPFLLS